MGGLSLGFLMSLENVEIEGYDINEKAVATYNHNLSRYSAKSYVMDLLKDMPLGRYDVVVGGSPCQPFSYSSHKIGEAHPLYPTFSRYFDIVSEINPKIFILENVKGLLRPRFQQLFQKQLKHMKDYTVVWKVLNAADYGVPQKRQRVIIVGYKDGVKWEYPQPTHAETETVLVDGRVLKPWVTVREAIGDIMDFVTFDYPKKLIPTNPKCGKIADLDKPSHTILTDGRGGDITFHTVLIPYTAFQKKRPPLNLNKPSRTIVSNLSKNARNALIPMVTYTYKEVRQYMKTAPTIGNISGGGPHYGRPLVFYAFHEDGILYRRLTVREVLRLQSFPDWWTFPENVKITWQYKLAGECVPPLMAYHLGVAVGKALNNPTKPITSEWCLPYVSPT